MDTISPRDRSRVMAAVHGKNTRPEMSVRRLVHGSGYRYRLHGAALPGRPDLVFPGRRKVIFVHGCFWHRHADSACPLARLPKTRLDFWLPKLEANRQRDAANMAKLHEAGWEPLVIWECELRDMVKIKERVQAFLGPAGQAKREC